MLLTLLLFCNLGDGPQKCCKFYELPGFSKFHELSEFLEALSFKKGHSSWCLSLPQPLQAGNVRDILEILTSNTRDQAHLTSGLCKI